MSLDHETARSISLVIVDLDDTLVSFDGVSKQCWLDACTRHQGKLQGLDPEVVAHAIRAEGELYWDDPERHRIGRLNLLYTRRKIVTSAISDLGIDDAEVSYAIADTYSTIRLDAMYVFEGAKDTLVSLRASGLRLALLTNGDSLGQREKINRFGLGELFDGIYIEEEIRYGKPQPEAFHRVLNDFDTGAQNTAIVGDNYEWEIRVPAEMGMTTVWVNRDGAKVVPPGSPNPDVIIASISELIMALRNLR